jgi:hypothetical protein
MNRVPDRKRLLRQYLRKKGRAWVAEARSHALYFISFSACLFLLCGSLSFGLAAIHRPSLSALLLAFACAVACCVCGTLASWSQRRQEGVQQASQLADVAPRLPLHSSTMNRVLYRKKQRIEYLLAKGTALVSVSALKFAAGAVVLAMSCFLVAYNNLPPIAVIVLAPFFFDVPYFLMRDGERVVTDLEQKARSIPYVPPVSLDSLPAEEVLVRGAEPPAAMSETLLRATVKDEATKAEELLRSSASG